MNNMKTLITTAGIIGLFLSTTLAMGDSDRYERGEYKDRYEKREHNERGERREHDERGEKKERRNGGFNKFFNKKLDVAPVNNSMYREECGSCHFAYQPGLLPSRSWRKMMGNLENHFEENAELDAETQAALTTYLVRNSADDSNYKRSRRIMNSLRNNSTPLRITKTPYFIRKHDEIPRRLVQGNPKLGSFSKCAACHLNADKGSYEEDDVRIPGVGRWRD